MKWRIVSDSSCDIFELDHKPDDLCFSTVPFVITVDDKDYVDDEDLDVSELVKAMASSKKSFTSCPSSRNARYIFSGRTAEPETA